MKYLLSLLLMVLLPSVSFSQKDTSYIEIDTSSLFINYTLTEVILDNFVRDACEYGLDSLEVINHIKHLDAIYTSELDSNKLGSTIYVTDTLSPIVIRGIILIDYNLTMNYSIFQLTIYHELGHWFGLDHGKGIMSENSENVFKSLHNWDRNVRKLMKEIKKNNYSYPESDLE